MHLGSRVSDADEGIANLFAEQFKSVFVLPSQTSLDTVPVSASMVHLCNLDISLAEVFEAINDLDSNKSAGEDGLPPIFVKSCAYGLARALWIIFNRSLNSGSFPESWKLSVVTPVFKSGLKSEVGNYRPISLLSCFPKIFEKLVTSKLSGLIRGSFSDAQHGFFPGRSTVTNLAIFANFVSSALDSRQQVDVVYTDFRKAFDSVDHVILLRKLNMCGIHGVLLQWLGSYLSGRSQVITVRGCRSQPIQVSSGVPQGSHLGPLLFCIFINDLAELFRFGTPLLFADDLKLFATVNCLDDAVKLQGDLDNLCNWCVLNRLPLNLTKCQVLRITRARFTCSFAYSLGLTVLSNIERVRDLGVTYNAAFSFVDHINGAKNLASKQLGFIMRHSRGFKNMRTFKLLYDALVRPHLEYASVIWAPHQAYLMVAIERVQHRFLRFASFRLGQPLNAYDHDYGPAQRGFNFLTMQQRLVLADLCFLFRIINGDINCPRLLELINFSALSRPLRFTPLFRVKFFRTNMRLSDPITRVCVRGSEIADRINFFGSSLDAFRRSVISQFGASIP